MAAQVVRVPFNLMSGSYEALIPNLRAKLAGPTPSEEIDGHPVLAKQTGDTVQPPRWVYVDLQSKGEAAPTLAIRSDNCYLVGFTNRQAKWFEFDFDNGGKQTLLPEATKLGYDGSYQRLVGGAGNLTGLKFGKFKASEAATVLWNHTQAKAFDGDDDNLGGDLMAPDLKKALATLVVTFCEAARFIAVYDIIKPAWDQVAGSCITGKEVKYTNKWRDISVALLGWKKDKNDDKWFKVLKESAKISSGKQALQVVQLVLNKQPPKWRRVLVWLTSLWSGDACSW